MFQLESSDDLGRKLAFPLLKVKTTIGRDPNCDIVLNDGDVSRQHVRVYVMNNTVRVKDEDSANGTYVNNDRVFDMADLSVGGELIIGSNQFFLKEVDEFKPSEEDFKLTMMLTIDQLRDMTQSFDALAEVTPVSGEDVAETKIVSKNEMIGNIFHKKIAFMAHPSLEVIFGPAKGKKFLLTPGDYRLGRSADCNIRLDDPMVSTLHGLIEVGEDAIVYNDADSRNGSVLNNKIVVTHTLAHGDVLVVGNSKLKYLNTAAAKPGERKRVAELVGDSIPELPWYVRHWVWLSVGTAALMMIIIVVVLLATE